MGISCRRTMEACILAAAAASPSKLPGPRLAKSTHFEIPYSPTNLKVPLVFQQALGHEKELVTSELRVPAANKSHEGHGDEAASVPVITPPRQRNAIHRGNTRSRNLGIAPAEAQVCQVTPRPPFPLKVGFRGSNARCRQAMAPRGRWIVFPRKRPKTGRCEARV